MYHVRMAQKISGGTAHTLPADMRKSLSSDKKARAAWEDITPLSRNEWICWCTFVKKKETREEHIEQVVKQLKEGKRRPCCWIGCIHRKDKEVGPSVKWVLSKGKK